MTKERWVKCPLCDYSGEVEVEVESRASFTQPYGDLRTEKRPCPECAGFGEIEREDQ